MGDIIDETFPVRCEACGERFENEEQLKIHLRLMAAFRAGEITWDEYLDAEYGEDEDDG